MPIGPRLDHIFLSESISDTPYSLIRGFGLFEDSDQSIYKSSRVARGDQYALL
jgi:hypothetical protein